MAPGIPDVNKHLLLNCTLVKLFWLANLCRNKTF